MYLQEMPKVDLNHSVVDNANSDPATGQYTFIEKKYVNYQNPETRPKWYLAWCRWTDKNNYAEFSDWKTKWGFSLCTIEDGYWPEGLAPTDGHYVTGDLILVKCPLETYIKRRKHEIGISEGSTKAIVQRFLNEAKADGVELEANLIRSL